MGKTYLNPTVWIHFSCKQRLILSLFAKTKKKDIYFKTNHGRKYFQSYYKWSSKDGLKFKSNTFNDLRKEEKILEFSWFDNCWMLLDLFEYQFICDFTTPGHYMDLRIKQYQRFCWCKTEQSHQFYFINWWYFESHPKNSNQSWWNQSSSESNARYLNSIKEF